MVCALQRARRVLTPKNHTKTQTEVQMPDMTYVTSASSRGANKRQGKLAGTVLTGDPMQNLLTRLTVPAVRDGLASRRMPTSGLKAELVQRLLDAKPAPTVAEVHALAREHRLNIF